MARLKPKSLDKADVGDVVIADDKLPALVVNDWTETKHELLCEYLKLQAHPRAGWMPPKGKGATYIDLFCGAGRSFLKGRRQFIEGSPLLAWNASKVQGAPFTKIYIADANTELRGICEERLRSQGAPVQPLEGKAEEAAEFLARELDPHGFHFAFLDPYSLGQLKFGIIRDLALLKRMDFIAHVSAMDLFRNVEMNAAEEQTQFESFAPGWKTKVPTNQPQHEVRRGVMDYWKDLVAQLGIGVAPRMRVMRNSVNRELYWLVFLSRHPLGERFWNLVLKYEPHTTGELFAH